LKKPSRSIKRKEFLSLLGEKGARKNFDLRRKRQHFREGEGLPSFFHKERTTVGLWLLLRPALREKKDCLIKRERARIARGEGQRLRFSGEKGERAFHTSGKEGKGGRFANAGCSPSKGGQSGGLSTTGSVYLEGRVRQSIIQGKGGGIIRARENDSLGSFKKGGLRWKGGATSQRRRRSLKKGKL